MNYFATFRCPKCGIGFEVSMDTDTTPTLFTIEERIEKFEARARLLADTHYATHEQSTRSIPDGNQEDTPADYAIIRVPPTADVVLFNKEGGFIGARWNPDQDPGTAIEGLAKEYGFNLRYGHAGRWDYERP